MGGCVESSPAISGNNAYIGVTVYGSNDVRRVTIEPFEEIASWSLGEESRATCSLEYDFVYSGVDTGRIFYKLDAYQEGWSNEYLAKFELPTFPEHFVGSAAHTTGGIVYTGNDNADWNNLFIGCFMRLINGSRCDWRLGFRNTGRTAWSCCRSVGFIRWN